VHRNLRFSCGRIHRIILPLVLLPLHKPQSAQAAQIRRSAMELHPVPGRPLQHQGDVQQSLLLLAL
jgi:hypothetical protein